MPTRQIYKMIYGPGGVTLRGGALVLWKCREHEVVLCGPAETGKTFGALHKLDTLLWKYPGAQAAMVRKTYKSTVGSVVQSFIKKIINPDAGIKPYGGEHPDWFDYPNGSRVWIGGMDNPDKILSSERDFIYVNQAEELALEDWEMLSTRSTGRAGNAPYGQLFGDCNPSVTLHWIRKRAADGKLILLKSTHRDNPILFDDAGVMTAQGKVSLGILESQTGMRYKRLFLGEWATAEGAVYDMFNASIHVQERDRSEFRRWLLAMDEGYTNPAVILLIGIDGDGRQHIAREFYRRGVLQRDVVSIAAEWTQEYGVELAAVDAAAAGLIADLRDCGIPAAPFKGRVMDGITAVQAILKVAGGMDRLR